MTSPDVARELVRIDSQPLGRLEASFVVSETDVAEARIPEPLAPIGEPNLTPLAAAVGDWHTSEIRKLENQNPRNYRERVASTNMEAADRGAKAYKAAAEQAQKWIDQVAPLRVWPADTLFEAQGYHSLVTTLTPDMSLAIIEDALEARVDSSALVVAMLQRMSIHTPHHLKGHEVKLNELVIRYSRESHRERRDNAKQAARFALARVRGALRGMFNGRK